MGKHLKLIIKQINKSYDTELALKNVINYMVRKKKGEQDIRYWRAYGASKKDTRKIYNQFIKIQKVAGKETGKRIRHFILSFPTYVDDANMAVIVAESVARFIFKEYQVIYALHEKEGNLHIHFALNPVSYRDGKKWHMSSTEFKEWKKEVQGIVNRCLLENGYEACEM